MEADRPTIAVGNDHFTITIGQTDLDQTIVLTQGNGIDTIGTRTGVGLQRSLLDHTLLRTEEQEV